MVSCVICYEKLGDTSPSDPKPTSATNSNSHVSATDCGHLFHTSCISKWMSSGRSRILCPVCKHSISPRRLTTIYQDWTTEVGKCEESSKNNVTSTSAKPPAEESRLKGSFADLNAKCIALETELSECYTQLKKQNELNTQTMATSSHLNLRLAESTVAREKLELIVTTQKKEKEKLAGRLISFETQRNLDAQKLSRLQMSLNQYKGLEVIASLGLDCEASSNKSAVDAYLHTGPKQQLNLFKALEFKCYKLLKERDKYFMLYENTKKEHEVTSILLEDATQQNLEYEKRLSNNAPIKKGARAPPISSSPNKKEPRVKSVNPFLKERNSYQDKQQEPSDSSSNENPNWTSYNPRKRPRSPLVFHDRETSLGDRFNSLSIDPIIDLTNEEVINNPPLKTKKNHIDEIKSIRRNVHGFFT